MADDTPQPEMKATLQSLSTRVDRVEGGLQHLADRFDANRQLIDERFNGVNDALKRIENAVTGPNAQDAATAVHITDLSRRVSDQEKGARDRETRLTIMESRLGTLGSVVKFIGFGGIITLIGLIAFYVGISGRLP